MQALTVLCALFAASTFAATLPCPRPCDCFVTDNGIQAANCTDLPDNSTAAWPQKILRIHFETESQSPPVMLKNGAFKRFPGLTYLDIEGGTIRYVGTSAFDGLPDLVELNLVDTGVRKLPRHVFAENRKLAFVSLKRNARLFVGHSFLVSESITELDLSECGLSALKSAYFKGLPNLKYLFAAKNQLRSLGSQFGPSGLKYVSVAHNLIENVDGDLDVYKRLRTIDLTGNPVNCTCDLSEIDRRLTARGVAFGNTVTCGNTGKPLGDLAESCSDNGMMRDEPADIYSADHLLKIDKSAIETLESIEDLGSGSGSGDGEETIVLPHTNNVESTATTTERAKTKSAENDTVIMTEGTVEKDVIKTGTVQETMAHRPSSPEPNELDTTEKTFSSTINPVTTISNSTTTTTTTTTITPITEEMTTTTVQVQPAAVPTVNSAGGNGTNNSSTARSNMDRAVIVSQTIQAPDDGEIGAGGGENVQSKVTNYLKSNVGVTVTAAVLAVVIVAIVYKATCAGKSRSHSIRRATDGHDDKIVELKDIKYVAANMDDSPSGGGSAEENLLEDRSDDDDDDDEEDGAESSPSPTTSDNARDRYDLLNSVMGAMENGVKSPAAASNGPLQDPQQQQVPTRVIVKLCETPKASRPITINNVH